MTVIYDTEQYHAYMDDEVHPKKISYVEWWTSVSEQELAAFMAHQEALIPRQRTKVYIAFASAS